MKPENILVHSAGLYDLDPDHQMKLAQGKIKTDTLKNKYLQECDVIQELADDNLIFKIADMGIAKLFSVNDKRERAKTDVGTPEYKNPQAFKDREYGYEADVWALGAVFYQMLSGFPPFHRTHGLTEE